MNTNKIIFYVLTFFIITGFATSNYWLPKFRPFGTSTTFTDSTNYVNLTGKGIKIPNDSLKVGKWMIAGTYGGGIYLDTNKKGELSFTGNSMYIYNRKDYGYTYFYSGEKLSGFSFNKSSLIFSFSL